MSTSPFAEVDTVTAMSVHQITRSWGGPHSGMCLPVWPRGTGLSLGLP